MNRALLGLGLLLCLCFSADAHVGSPDIFYDGMVGPYPARIMIRMPNVVPGRAEISVRVQTDGAVTTSFLPLYAETAVSNAPPPDLGRLVVGETNLYAGELWLMSSGAYSVEVRIKGNQGEGMAQIPVTSVALRQLPLPSFLGKLLLGLAAILVLGGIAMAAAAAREAALPAGTTAGRAAHWKGFFAALAMAIIFGLALWGGKHWWQAEENSFRRHLRDGPWPDLATEVRVQGGERILQIEVGKKAFARNDKVYLIPDHGKLMHLFLIRDGTRDAFAHVHPIRRPGGAFDVVLPPLPEGSYTLYCDLTFEGGESSTASTSIVLPPLPAAGTDNSPRPALLPDPDDSWAASVTNQTSATPSAGGGAVYRLADGTQVAWQTQTLPRIRQDASLRFVVTDAAGEPVMLEPYLGMLCHAAVLRSDGTVFAHLHPSGNYSMAAQTFFENKLATETAGGTPAGGMNHSMHPHHAGAGMSSFYLPYEFPEPGDYRIWVQFKVDGRVQTAVFDTHVGS